MSETDKILEYIEKNGQASVDQLLKEADIGLARTLLYRQLSRMTQSGQLTKIGAPPKKVYYASKRQNIVQNEASAETKNTPRFTSEAESSEPVFSTKNLEELPFYLRWCSPKYNLDPELIRSRYYDIQKYLWPPYSDWATGKAAGDSLGRFPKNLFWDVIGGFYSGIIWVIAALSVWGQAFFNKGRSALAAQEKKPIPVIFIIAAALVVGGLLGYRIALILNPPQIKDQSKVFEYELDRTKRLLVTTQDELQRAKNELAQLKEEKNSFEMQARIRQSLNSQLRQSIDDKDQIQKQLEGHVAQLTQTIADQEKKLQIKDQELQQARANVIVPQDLPSTSPVTIADVVNWTKQGMLAADIIDHLKAGKSSYRLIPADVQYLRQNNVNESVIQYMVDAAR